VIRSSLCVALLLAVLCLATAAPVLADDATLSGETGSSWPAALAWLVPIGLGMLACGAVPPDRVAAVIRIGWLALGVSVVGYWLAGFAFQFGGAGFAYDHPDLAGLAREWTWAPLEATWGSDWGAIGLVGYLLRGPASTPAALRLFLAQLPWITTAVAVPLWSLQGRTGPVVLFLSATLQALLYALLGNWAWGGGWLANLGLNLGLGHGYVDALGAGPVHLAGAASALAGMLAFGVRGYMRQPAPGRAQPAEQLALPGLAGQPSYVPMPALHLPVLATFGAWLAAIGWLGWASSTPLHAIGAPYPPWTGTWINVWLAAGGGAVVALAFSWLTTGEGNALMTARGVLGALVAGGAGLPFLPPWAALAVGAGAGLLVPTIQYTIEHLLRFDDPTSAVATHGVPALWGLLAVGLLAGGQGGEGWNRVGAGAYLGIEGQGVSGYVVLPGYASDWPGQFRAQAIGVAAIGVAAFVLSWLLFAGVQGLAHAWVGEYTLRLPRRPRRVQPRPRPGRRHWPRIRIVRQDAPAPVAGGPVPSPKAPARERGPLASAASSARRRIGTAWAALVAAARRVAGRSGETSAQHGDAGPAGPAESTEADAGAGEPGDVAEGNDSEDDGIEHDGAEEGGAEDGGIEPGTGEAG
jgi:Amt family ammonium transporter